MAWCMISMLLGALVFAAGIVFERLLENSPEEITDEPLNYSLDEKLRQQWENLLDYDGTEQEERDDE